MDYISINNFEGPLDLLLHLVKESNIDILDIKVEEIAEKYLEYIKHEEEININISSSYLVMASELMYLKSKSLLPNTKKEEKEDEEEELTKETLINKLIEYQKYKEMITIFKNLEENRKKIYIKSPEKESNYIDTKVVGASNIEELTNALKNFLERKEKEKPLETTITQKEYSVKERKNNIKEVLKIKKKVYLEELFEEYNRPVVVVTFLSILEMVKEKEISIIQDKNFDKILIELRS